MAAHATVDSAAFADALRTWAQRTIEATQSGVKAGAEIVREQIQDNLARSYYPPASQPGQPPAWRTGYLHDSVYVRTLAVESGWQARIYPSTVYARIQELSGWAGREHRSFLPARPYVRPAVESSAERAAAAIADAWRKAQPGG